jgi:sialic acid synthase SpsE
MKLTELLETINPYEKKLYKPYIIAEAGVNHEGSMELAKRLCDEALEGGASFHFKLYIFYYILLHKNV